MASEALPPLWWHSESKLGPMITDEIQRAIRHEAGHLLAAVGLGFPVAGVSVSKGMPFVLMHLDSAERTPRERFTVLASGIAAEQYFYGRYDQEACRNDVAKISERGGLGIETYLPEAICLMESNALQLRSLVSTLVSEFLEMCNEAVIAGSQLEPSGPPSFELLSAREINAIVEKLDSFSIQTKRS